MQIFADFKMQKQLHRTFMQIIIIAWIIVFVISIICTFNQKKAIDVPNESSF